MIFLSNNEGINNPHVQVFGDGLVAIKRAKIFIFNIHILSSILILITILACLEFIAY